MITIKKASIDYLHGIVAIHQQAFPDFFLTTLGESFLRLYYSCMCRCEGAVTLCALENGEVVGFSTTALKSARFNVKLMKDNFCGFAWEAIKLLFTNPMSLVHLTRNMSKTNSNVADKGEYAELFSIGVSPTCQGKGVGSMLLKETECLVFKNGGAVISLTTDKNDNASTISFYKRNGYEVKYEFVAFPNRPMYRFVKVVK